MALTNAHLFFIGVRLGINRINPSPSPPPPPQEFISQQEADSTLPIRNNPSTETIERQIHEKINTYRNSLGLKPLTLDYRITNESRLYSAKMASGEATFSHDGFENRAASLEKQALKYASVAENLALIQGYDDLATVAVEGWIDSPGHHKNIIGDFDLTGIGVVQNQEGAYYFTQLFLKRL
ncbi:CAP domain-containing protein [Picosynechococcus sp. NKBG15041c]|uniref:CAP domain-containing protein n=1 Tax=Picosynechococcus sp. NKBG15041c TaxID=1407650 RepID=UPI00041D0850|nr:CAP domain-containing protein [Picosynechococcus sp. NKBG15041c]